MSSFSGTFNWLNNPNAQPGADNRAFNVSVIDGKNQYVNAGISFTRRPDLDFIHVGLAKRVSQEISFGASVKRFSSRTGSLLNNNGAAVSGFEGGLSAAFLIPASVSEMPIQIGLTADNLRHKATDEQYVGPKEMGGGVKVNLSKLLMLYGDLVERFSNFYGAYPHYSSGAEIALGNDFYTRGGLMGFREKGWSAGAGWVGPKIGVSYGYQNKHVEADRSFEHAVTMDIFM